MTALLFAHLADSLAASLILLALLRYTISTLTACRVVTSKVNGQCQLCKVVNGAGQRSRTFQTVAHSYDFFTASYYGH